MEISTRKRRRRCWRTKKSSEKWSNRRRHRKGT